MERASERKKRNALVLLLMSLFLLAALPVTSFGKHRDRRSRRNFDNWKCGRFVNCHDARDGRWDGRGRRRNSISIWDRRSNWRDNDWRIRNGDNRWWANRNDRRRWNSRDDDRRWRRTTNVRNSRWYR